jgi:preprotein translocase subunit SecB
MAEENGAAAQIPQIRMQILAQYIRDLSFENVLAQKGNQGGEVKPDIQVQVSLDAKKRPTEGQYEVAQKYKITATNQANRETLFLLEIDYAAIYAIGGVPDAQLHPFLLIECPRMVFPFVRRIVSDLTRDGGFPPLNLDGVDFLQLYRNEMVRRTQAPS